MRRPPASISTSALTAPGWTLTTVPASWLRAESSVAAGVGDDDHRRCLDQRERRRADGQAEPRGALVGDDGDDVLAAADADLDLVVDRTGDDRADRADELVAGARLHRDAPRGIAPARRSRPPASMWTTSSAKASTSAGSWVIRRIGSARRACSSAQLGAQACRAAARRARRTARRAAARAARAASARASATRWRWPPESWSGKRSRERAQLERVEPAIDRRAAGVAARIAPARGEAEGDVLAHRQVREQRVLLEQVAAVALARRHVDAGCGVEQRLAGERDAAGVGPQQAGDRLQRQRLAGARRAEQDQPLDVAAEGDVELEALRAARRPSCGSRRPTSCVTSARDARRREPAGEQQDGDAGHRGQQHQQVGEIVLPRLHRLVDGDRERLRLARECCRRPSASRRTRRGRARRRAARRPGCRARRAAG